MPIITNPISIIKTEVKTKQSIHKDRSGVRIDCLGKLDIKDGKLVRQ
jgi:hypothetical protein